MEHNYSVLLTPYEKNVFEFAAALQEPSCKHRCKGAMLIGNPFLAVMLNDDS